MRQQPPARRAPTFATLADAVADAERLRDGGYDRAGNWDLSQTCDHLADWLRFAVDGYPPAPLPLRPVLFALRHTLAPVMLRRTLASGHMRAGGPTMRQTVHATGGDDRAAVERFRMAVERFTNHPGPYRPSPMFGPLDRETTTQLQLVHCAHHLGFLVPRG